MESFNYKKATQSIIFFLNQNGGSLNKMKALKLIWLADRLHLRTYGRTITMDSYIAMKNGPVASGTRDILELNVTYLADNELEYAIKSIKPKDKFTVEYLGNEDLDQMSDSDIEILTKIQAEFGHLGEFNLSELSHSLPEWKKYEDPLSHGGSRFDMEKIDFFKNVAIQPKVFNENEDMLETTRNYFLMYN
jgi:uncharacterized phage-associated protein